MEELMYKQYTLLHITNYTFDILNLIFCIDLITFSILLPLDKECGRLHFWLD